MSKTSDFKLGSKLIEKGKAYKVFKVKKERVGEKTETVIYFRPLFQTSINESLICSIPEGSLANTDIRKPTSVMEVKLLLKSLSKRLKKKRDLDVVKAKSALELNDIYAAAKVLKRYWKEKKESGVNFSTTKKDILNIAANRVIEEVALAIGLSLDEARKKITSALDN